MVWADNVECMPRALERRNTVERYLAMSIETELVAMRKENAVLRILNNALRHDSGDLSSSRERGSHCEPRGRDYVESPCLA